MSRPPACEHGTDAAGTEPILDYRWWASNGPTAGYLMRLAVEAAAERDPTHSRALRIGLDVTRLAAAAPYVLTVDTDVSRSGITRHQVAFHQGRPFAVASVLTGTANTGTAVSDATPPPALPPEAYPAMTTPSPTLPPVTAQFVYRPTHGVDSPEPKPGWDFVWVTPTDPGLRGRALVASAVDSWYPAHFMRAVRQHLRTGTPIEQPEPTVLMAASLSFTAGDPSYKRARHLLLATQLSSTAGGHVFERSEVWSDRGSLLATAELIRSHPIAGLPPDPTEERNHHH